MWIAVVTALSAAGLLMSVQAHGSSTDVPPGSIILDLSDRLIVSDLSGGNRRVVPTPRGPAGQPTWAPDGLQLAITRGGSVYVVDAASRRPRRIDTRPPLVGAPRWSSDGGQVAYEFWAGWRRACARHGRADAGVVVADASAGGRSRTIARVQPARLHPKRARYFYVSGWHPTLHRLLYLEEQWPEEDCGRYLGGGPIETALLHVGVNGGRPTLVARNHSIGSPQWSPDGKMIAYGLSDYDRCRLYVARADGSRRPRVFGRANNACVADSDQWIAWSGSGGELYVAEGHQLVAVNVRNGRRRTVLADLGLSCTGDFGCITFIHAVSSDGRYVAVEAEGGKADRRVIIVASSNGLEQLRLPLPQRGLAAVFIS